MKYEKPKIEKEAKFIASTTMGCPKTMVSTCGTGYRT